MLKTIVLLMFLCQPAFGTTIAYDGSCLASDSQRSYGPYKAHQAVKLERIGLLYVGCAGAVSDIKRFKLWLRTGGPKPKLRNVRALVFDGTQCMEYDETCLPNEVRAPYAIGSGAPEAMAAMMAGASGVRAIEITEQLDLFTGGPVQRMP